jgi:hypothetical protein
VRADLPVPSTARHGTTRNVRRARWPQLTLTAAAEALLEQIKRRSVDIKAEENVLDDQQPGVEQAGDDHYDALQAAAGGRIANFHFSGVDIRSKQLGPWHAAMVTAWISHYAEVKTFVIRDNPGIIGGIDPRENGHGPDCHGGVWRRMMVSLQKNGSVTSFDATNVR